jgi:hypothetical protein
MEISKECLQNITRNCHKKGGKVNHARKGDNRKVIVKITEGERFPCKEIILDTILEQKQSK